MSLRRLLTPAIALPLLLVVTVAHRAWVAWSMLDLTPDSGSVGLMALHIMEGGRPLFLYGFTYSGALLPYVTAGVFCLVGPSYFSFIATAVLFTLALVGMTYLLFSELFGKKAGLAAAACVALPDLVTAWYTTAPDCSYTPMFLLAACTLWLACRIARRPLGPAALWRHALTLGVVAGLSVWVHMISVVSLLCGAAVLLPYFIRERFRPRVLAPFLVGALPFAFGFLPYLYTESGGGSVSTRWNVYASVLRYRLSQLWNESLPHFYSWPSPLPHAAGVIAGCLLGLLAVLYLAAVLRRKGDRGLALLPVAFVGLFFAFYLPHDLATEAAPRYLAQAWIILIGGMFGVVCSTPLARVRQTGFFLLAGWLAYNAAGVAVYGVSHRPKVRANAADHVAIIEGARATQVGHVMLLDGYDFAANGQTLTFLARDEVRFVAVDEERHQGAAQTADDDDAPAFAGKPATWTTFTNALQRLGASYEEREAGSLRVAYNIHLPTPRGRAIPARDMTVIADTALSGLPVHLLDRMKDTMLMGHCDGHSRVDIDLGKEHAVSGLALSPVGLKPHGLPSSFRLEGSRDGTTYELIQEVNHATRLVYGIGGRVYAKGDYGWLESRFTPTPARYLRLTPLEAVHPAGLWFISELFVFETDDEQGVTEDERDAVVDALVDSEVTFTYADRWLSAALMRKVSRHYEAPPAYPRYNEHLRIVGSTVPLGVRRFQPQPGEAVAVEAGLAEETARVLRRTYGPELRWSRKLHGGYTVFLLEEVPTSDLWLWWNGFMPLTMR